LNFVVSLREGDKCDILRVPDINHDISFMKRPDQHVLVQH
jgi:hypothetical protein